MSTPTPPPFSVGKEFRVGDYYCGQGFAERITLPNGKVTFTGQQSVLSSMSRELGYPVEIVRVQGNCIYANIEDRATHGAPVWIDGEYITGKQFPFATESDLVDAKLQFPRP
jgi:hypothetical protein